MPARVRRAARDHHAGLHAAERRRPRLRGDLRRPRRRPLRAHRRRAPPAVDARQDRGAGGHRAQRHPPAGAHPPARRAARAGARDPRAGACSGCSASRWRSAPRRRSIDAERERCRVEMQEALSDLRSALWSVRWRRCPPRPARRWPPSSSAWSRPPAGAELQVDLAGRRSPSRPRSSRWPSRCWPRRCATSPSTPSPTRVEVRVARRRGHVQRSRSATTASAPARAAPGMGLRLAAFEALQHGGVVEFGRAGRGRVAGAAGRPAGGGRRERTPRRRAASERKLRVLVVDDHDVVHWGFRVLLGEQPWVERCLAARTGAEALELLPDAAPRRRARGPVPGRRVGRRRVRLDPPGLAVDARAADLRRGADVAGRGPGGRGVGLRLQGLGGARGRARRCGWSGSG